MNPSPSASSRTRGVASTSSYPLRSRRLSPAVAVCAVLLLSLCAGFAAMAEEKEAIEWSVEAPLAAKSLLLDIARVEGLDVVVGERGHILVSHDAGATWRQAKVPTRATLTGVWFHDGKRGWAVGHDAVIVRTTDGGVTWERVHWDPGAESPFLDVLFVNESRGFAIGAYGALYVTEDGGKSWASEPISDEDDFHLNQIARSASGKLYIAAEAGAIYRSDDDGVSWTKLESPYDGSFFGVMPLESDALLIFGLRGHLLRSEDAGANWTAVDTGTVAMLNSGVLLPDGTIVVAGLGGVVLVSKDGGRTFSLHQQQTRAGIQAVVDAGGGRLLLAGEGGVRALALTELVAKEGK
ncbi:MAG: YCF48-related protein [Thermoanaerobaculia bacterium]